MEIRGRSRNTLEEGKDRAVADLGPAHDAAQAITRIVILLVLTMGFFATVGVGFWLGDKWFGGFSGNNRSAGIPLAILFPVYLLVALILFQFW